MVAWKFKDFLYESAADVGFGVLASTFCVLAGDAADGVDDVGSDDETHGDEDCKDCVVED